MLVNRISCRIKRLFGKISGYFSRIDPSFQDTLSFQNHYTNSKELIKVFDTLSNGKPGIPLGLVYNTYAMILLKSLFLAKTVLYVTDTDSIKIFFGLHKITIPCISQICRECDPLILKEISDALEKSVIVNDDFRFLINTSLQDPILVL
jgi:hypothetical protein